MTNNLCKLAITDEQLNVHMPDGQKIPEQVTCTVVQSLDSAVNRPRRALVRFKMWCEVVDKLDEK